MGFFDKLLGNTNKKETYSSENGKKEDVVLSKEINEQNYQEVERIRQQIVIGMPYEDLRKILGGRPTSTNGMHGEFCYWDRPEGEYYMYIQNYRLRSIDKILVKQIDGSCIRI